MIERINLIPEEIQRIKMAGRKRPLVIFLLLSYVLGLGAFYFYQQAKIRGKRNNIEQVAKQRNELIAQSARYKEVIERINLTQRKEEDIKKRLEVIDSLLAGRVAWSEILRNITHLIPDGLWFVSLSTYDLAKAPGAAPAESVSGLPSTASIGGKGVKFDGVALSNLRIAEFIFAMENSQFFGNVLLTYSQKREFQGRDLYDFEITADLKTVRR